MQQLKKRLVTFPNPREGFELLKCFETFYAVQNLVNPNLNVTGAVATASLGNAIYAVIDGVLSTKATASTITITGASVANNSFNVYLFALDASGALLCYAGTPATTLAGVQLPLIQEHSYLASGSAASAGGLMGQKQVVIGGMVIANTSGAAFIPNTTLLNVVNLGTSAINLTGAFFPTQLNAL